MEEFKYLVHDDEGKIEDKIFDNFADAFDYAQGGLVTFIDEIPYQDGKEVEDGEQCVWTWDDTFDREQAIQNVQSLHDVYEAVDEDNDLVDCIWCLDPRKKSDCVYDAEQGWICKDCLPEVQLNHRLHLVEPPKEEEDIDEAINAAKAEGRRLSADEIEGVMKDCHDKGIKPGEKMAKAILEGDKDVSDFDAQEQCDEFEEPMSEFEPDEEDPLEAEKLAHSKEVMDMHEDADRPEHGYEVYKDGEKLCSVCGSDEADCRTKLWIMYPEEDPDDFELKLSEDCIKEDIEEDKLADIADGMMAVAESICSDNNDWALYCGLKDDEAIDLAKEEFANEVEGLDDKTILAAFRKFAADVENRGIDESCEINEGSVNNIKCDNSCIIDDPDKDLTYYHIWCNDDEQKKDAIPARQALKEILDFIKKHIKNRKDISLAWMNDEIGNGDVVVSVYAQGEVGKNEPRTMSNWIEAEKMIRNALHLHNEKYNTEVEDLAEDDEWESFPTYFKITCGKDSLSGKAIPGEDALEAILGFINKHKEEIPSIDLWWEDAELGTGDPVVNIDRAEGGMKRTVANWPEAERKIRNALHLHNEKYNEEIEDMTDDEFVEAFGKAMKEKHDAEEDFTGTPEERTDHLEYTDKDEFDYKAVLPKNITKGEDDHCEKVNPVINHDIDKEEKKLLNEKINELDDELYEVEQGLNRLFGGHHFKLMSNERNGKQFIVGTVHGLSENQTRSKVQSYINNCTSFDCDIETDDRNGEIWVGLDHFKLDLQQQMFAESKELKEGLANDANFDIDDSDISARLGEATLFASAAIDDDNIVIINMSTTFDIDDFEYDWEPDGPATYVPYGSTSVMYDDGKGGLNSVEVGGDFDWQIEYMTEDDKPLTREQAMQMLGLDTSKAAQFEREIEGEADEYLADYLKESIEDDPDLWPDHDDDGYDDYDYYRDMQDESLTEDLVTTFNVVCIKGGEEISCDGYEDQADAEEAAKQAIADGECDVAEVRKVEVEYADDFETEDGYDDNEQNETSTVVATFKA